MPDRHIRWAAVALALLVAVSVPHPASACTQGDCPRPHNEIAGVSFAFPGDAMAAGPQPFRLTGFGLGHTDEEVLFCDPHGPNPPLDAAEIDWVDFRFYALLPGAGVVKATLNRDHRSFVRLEATTPEGLFPAAFTNNVFLTLLPLDLPGVRYENAEVLQVFAPSTPVAPPDSSVISNLLGEAVFDITEGKGTPGAPDRIVISQGVQTFLDPVGLRLSRLGSEGAAAQLFRVDNPLTEAVTAVFFSYVAETDPALTDDFDGILQIPAGGSVEFVVDYAGIPTGHNPTAWVDVMVLSPIDVQGHDRVAFPLGVPPPVVEVPTLDATALVALLVLLAGLGTYFLTRGLRRGRGDRS